MSAARIVHLASTASTMSDAAELAARGEAHGTVVVADVQTAGVGRHGHKWESGDDGGLYFSMIFRLGLPPEELPVLTMALGLAVQSAVNDFAQVAADLRWPNDVLLNEKKLAGILVQASPDALIAGIGINVNQRSFPEELRLIATSLHVETGLDFEKLGLLERLRVTLPQYAQILVDRGRLEIFRLFTDHSSYVSGKDVEVDLGGRVVAGTTAGLDDNGFLLLATATRIETVIAGGVRPACGD